MKKAVALAAVAGLATVASAQYTINITADVTSANFGDVITWTVSTEGLGSAEYVYGYDLNLLASGNFGDASAFADALQALVGPTAGTPAGSSILGASGGQSSLLSGNAQVTGDVVLGTFTVVAGNAEGFLSYDIADGGALGGVNVLRTKTGSDFNPDIFNGLPTIVSDAVEVVPTPASAALLGLGGLVATRRRR